MRKSGSLANWVSRFVAVLACFIIVASMVACAVTSKNGADSTPTPMPTPQTTGQKVGILLPESEFFSFLDQATFTRYSYIEEKLRAELGVSFSDRNIISETAHSNDDAAKKVDAMLELGVTMLIVAPYPEKQPVNNLLFGNETNAFTALRTSLTKASEQGVYIAGWGETVTKFEYNAFVQLPTFEQIGIAEANFVVEKLQLKEATESPKTIEVFLSAGKTVRDDLRARDYFKGVFGVLQPYFENGKLINPSGVMTKETTLEDYKKFEVSASDENEMSDLLTEKLSAVYGYGTDAQKKLDAIIATDDYLASACKKPLEDAGINPEAQDSAWPLITGFGGNKTSVVNIVNKNQSMTLIYDTNALVTDLTKLVIDNALRLDNKQPVKHGKPTIITTKLLLITQANLMNEMVNAGYISPQDAGL
jgi:ABC-type xylose transport system substrate-binding protein